MSAPALTRDLAWSIAQDRANRHMRAAGRSKWSRDDYELAIETFDRLWPEERDYAAGSAAPIPSWIADAIRSFGFDQDQHVHHANGDPTNNDLDNLEVRTGHADVDPDRKGRES